MMKQNGSELIAAERKRQVEAEGYNESHDDSYDVGELCSAAHCFLIAGDCLANAKVMMGLRHRETPDELKREILDGKYGIGVSWPWDEHHLKIDPSPIRNLVKAGALIAAEIDRLQRLEVKKGLK